MAKKHEIVEEVDPAKLAMAQQGAPADYEVRSDDVVGYWDPKDGDPIHFVPLGCKMFDSSIDETKVSQLVFGRLVDPCSSIMGADGENSEPVQIDARRGEIVGVWAKPGMRALCGLGGVPVYMYLSGYKDTGKVNKMATFTVKSKGAGVTLLISEDAREKSRAAKDPLGLLKYKSSTASKASPPNAPAPNPDPDSANEDDIPF